MVKPPLSKSFKLSLDILIKISSLVIVSTLKFKLSSTSETCEYVLKDPCFSVGDKINKEELSYTISEVLKSTLLRNTSFIQNSSTNIS